MRDWIIFLFVHLVIPIIGIIFYGLLVRRIKQKQITEPPTVQLFWIFGTHGVMIILIMTSLIWKWSGMASLGAFASVSIGPLITGATAISVLKKRRLSIYHKWTFWLSVGYIGLVLSIISSSLVYNGIK